MVFYGNLNGGLDAEAGNDDVGQQDKQSSDDQIGHDLEGLAGHGAVLVQARAHVVGVTARHGAQLVLDLIVRWLLLCRLCGAFFLRLDRLFLLWLGLYRCRFGLLGHRSALCKRSAQVRSAIGTKLDAARQLLAAAVAEFGAFTACSADACSVAIGGIAVIFNDQDTIDATAHGKALGAHDLTVVYQKFLL